MNSSRPDSPPVSSRAPSTSNWREVTRGILASTFEPQRVTFPQTITARHLRLTALSGFGTDATAALAELAVIYAGPKLAEGGDDADYKRSKTATTDIDEPTATPARPKNPPPRRKRTKP